MGLNPRCRYLRVVGHALQILVAKADDEVDVGIREGLEDVGIGVVEFYSADVEGLEKDGDSRR